MTGEQYVVTVGGSCRSFSAWLCSLTSFSSSIRVSYISLSSPPLSLSLSLSLLAYKSQQRESHDAVVARLCEKTNELNIKIAELQHYQTLARDLNIKMEAMERMAEQASGVKMALSRRLEQLIVELKEVRGVATRLAQQVEVLQQTNAMLNRELARHGRQ